MKTYIAFMDKVNSVLKIMLALMLAAAFIALLLQVFGRFVFNIPFSWTEELSRYLMIWIAFIGSSVAIRHQQLIRIEALTHYLSKNMRIGIHLVSALVMILFFVVVCIYSLDLLKITSLQSSPALHLPMSVPYSAIPVGCLLMLCNTIVSFFDMIQKGE